MASGREDSIAEDFRTHFYETLRRRGIDNLQFIVGLEEKPVMFRPYIAVEEGQPSEAIPFCDLFAHSISELSRLVPFRQVLARAFRGMPQFSQTEGWASITLWFAAAAACRYIKRLMDQTGSAHCDVLDIGQVPPDFDRMFRACMCDARGVADAGLAFADRCIKALVDHASDSSFAPNAAFVRFVPKPRSVRVEWIAGDQKKTVLRDETLRQFVARLTQDAGWEGLFGAVKRIAGARKQHGEIGRAILELVSPRVAQAAATACSRNSCVSMRLGTGFVRGKIPMSIWLYIDPSQEYEGMADVTIAANRAHDEFILEGAPPRKGLYYFPPAVAVAKLSIAPDGLAVNHLPTVLVPKGGVMWIHPYSGCLRRTSHTNAIAFDEGEPAYRLPSREAQEQFHNLAQRSGVSSENDLCLSGQRTTINSLCAQFNEGTRRGGEPDVLGLVNALHDVVRVGLTRAHCQNEAAPRVSIRETLYPLPAPTPPEWLAHRVFAYDPDRPR